METFINFIYDAFVYGIAATVILAFIGVFMTLCTFDTSDTKKISKSSRLEPKSLAIGAIISYFLFGS